MDLVEALQKEHSLSQDNFSMLIHSTDDALRKRLFAAAQSVTLSSYGPQIYIRGLIEFTNYCYRNCYYCGLRCANKKVSRYRLTAAATLTACQAGYAQGLRTFVLQGGEDPYFSDSELCAIVRKLHELYPDCAITLSVGERSYASYEKLYQAGATRYLLRHETANPEHYAALHPPTSEQANRLRCLRDLKAIGYQTGAGFMVGAPYETDATLWENIQYLRELKPHMIGIGPFIPQQDTPFAHYPAGSIETTLRLLAILRLLFPSVLLPATTALGTLHPDGLILGVLAGANVIMPNLTPEGVRHNYKLYNGKTDGETRTGASLLAFKEKMHSIGREVVIAKGDYKEG